MFTCLTYPLNLSYITYTTRVLRHPSSVPPNPGSTCGMRLDVVPRTLTPAPLLYFTCLLFLHTNTPTLRTFHATSAFLAFVVSVYLAVQAV